MVANIRQGLQRQSGISRSHVSNRVDLIITSMDMSWQLLPAQCEHVFQDTTSSTRVRCSACMRQEKLLEKVSPLTQSLTFTRVPLKQELRVVSELQLPAALGI